MCDPITATLLATSTAIGVAGQYQSGKFNAAISDINRNRSLAAAKDARERGQMDAATKRMQGRLVVGKQRAGFGASGVKVDQGSALDTQVSTIGINEIDALTIIDNADREAQGFESQADSFALQGQLDQQAAKFGVATSLLGGAGDLWKAK